MSAPGTRREDAGRRHASGGRGGRRAGRLGEDLAGRGSGRSLGLAASGRAPPGDEPVRADEDRAVAGDLAMAYPGAARVVQVPVEVADPQRVEREVRLRGELPGSFAPGLAVHAGDQQEPVPRQNWQRLL